MARRGRLSQGCVRLLILILALAASMMNSGAQGITIVAVAGGGAHSLALDSAGRVWAWGNNSAGQLGDGTRGSRSTPRLVLDPSDPSGYLTHIVAISASGMSMALKDDGTVRAWGPNNIGQLGVGVISADVLFPTVVAGLTHVTSISAGGSHALALQDNQVYAWGSNNEGQLGLGAIDTAAHQTPTLLPLAGVIAVAASRNNDSYVITQDTMVWAWGRNTVGQLGRNTGGAPQAVPARVLKSTTPGDFLDGVVAIAASNASAVAVLSDRTVWTWGFNSNGQLGDGSMVNRPFAAPVPSLTDVDTVTGGTFFFLARRVDGTAWGWGQNSNGQLGDGTTLDRWIPVQVTDPADPSGSLQGVDVLAAGGTHTLALLADHRVRVWGAKGVGQLGDGTSTALSLAPELIGLAAVASVSADGNTSMALQSGIGWAWGANGFGQLGAGGTENRLTPTTVPALSSATSIAPGGSHTLALQPDGTVLAWGLGTNGQLGNGAALSSLVPVAVSGLSNVSAVSAEGLRSMALRGDGTVWGWGFNAFGQLGDGTTVNRLTPVQAKQDAATFLTDVEAISAAGGFSVAVKHDRSVWAWGQNNLGQLGDGSMAPNRVFAVQVVTATGPLSGIVAVAAGGAHTLALAGDGTVWAWGQNTFGQLGNDTSQDSHVAIQVPGLAGIRAIAAGGSFSLALAENGAVLSWGANTLGQLGDGTTIGRSVPMSIQTFGDVVQIASGNGHSLARTIDDLVWAWGSNDSGQIGNGLSPNETTPLAVMAAQAIEFAPLADKNFGEVVTLDATGGLSGNPVTFTAAGRCTVLGNALTLTSAGTCSVTAHQVGNEFFNAAPDVTHTFTIRAQLEWANPVNADGTSIFKLNSVIPVRFTLVGTTGDVVARIYVARVSGGIAGSEEEPSNPGNADTGNTFRRTGNTYSFNWGTKGLQQGIWQIRVDLGDGLPRTVNVSLRK